MTDIEKRFASNGDDGRLIERQLLGRTGVKGKFRCGLAKNRVANLTPLRLRRYFNNNDSRFIASCIPKFDM